MVTLEELERHRAQEGKPVSMNVYPAQIWPLAIFYKPPMGHNKQVDEGVLLE